MKKKIVLVTMGIVTVITGWGFSQNKKSDNLSNLTLANIEALARGEVVVGRPCAQTCQNCWCVYSQYPGDYFELPGEFK